MDTSDDTNYVEFFEGLDADLRNYSQAAAPYNYVSINDIKAENEALKNEIQDLSRTNQVYQRMLERNKSIFDKSALHRKVQALSEEVANLRRAYDMTKKDLESSTHELQIVHRRFNDCERVRKTEDSLEIQRLKERVNYLQREMARKKRVRRELRQRLNSAENKLSKIKGERDEIMNHPVARKFVDFLNTHPEIDELP